MKRIQDQCSKTHLAQSSESRLHTITAIHECNTPGKVASTVPQLAKFKQDPLKKIHTSFLIPIIVALMLHPLSAALVQGTQGSLAAPVGSESS